MDQPTDKPTDTDGGTNLDEESCSTRLKKERKKTVFERNESDEKWVKCQRLSMRMAKLTKRSLGKANISRMQRGLTVMT